MSAATGFDNFFASSSALLALAASCATAMEGKTEASNTRAAVFAALMEILQTPAWDSLPQIRA